MSAIVIDPLIIGHNPFFGIDHLSAQRGNERSRFFEDVRRVVAVLRRCHDLGARAMMMSTHPRALAMTQAINADPLLSKEWRLYPVLPYVQKYVRGANEKGLVNLALDTLSQVSFGQKVGLFLRGSRGILVRDLQEMIRLLIDIEMAPFANGRLGAVFLHDVLTDLALGLRVDSVLALFREHVEAHYGVTAGFITKNVPLLRARLDAMDWDEVLVMASLNPAGFYVNPSLERCAAALERPGLTFVAMNTLASGQLSPEVAYSYLARFSAIRSVAVGLSRLDHAAETIDAIRRHLPCAAGIPTVARLQEGGS
ncbi:MAG: hypothetical protein HYS14_01690, partial [Candidatus Rokubacteria bacterium]|nr:hypothetical protein [Candidatus Rokubacteria bacterium]